jgi:hypothetical protein
MYHEYIYTLVIHRVARRKIRAASAGNLFVCHFALIEFDWFVGVAT